MVRYNKFDGNFTGPRRQGVGQFANKMRNALPQQVPEDPLLLIGLFRERSVSKSELKVSQSIANVMIKQKPINNLLFKV
jgi:hypothetical protein